MTKDEKKYVFQKLKRAAVIAASAVTGLTAGGCGTNSKKDDAVANNDIVFVEEQTEATTPVDTIETTTTLSPLNKDSNRKKSYDDDSVDSEYVETSYENDFTTPTTITSIKNSNNNSVVDDNTTSKTNSKTNTTTAKTNEKNPNTKIETNTKNPTTTAKVNENPTTTKATTKATTRPTTAKTTTTVTTTTTEAVTEPPVTEPVQPVGNVELANIGSDFNSFYVFRERMTFDLISIVAPNSFFEGDIGYGYTDFSDEIGFVLERLNRDYTTDGCLNSIYSNYDDDIFNHCTYFAFNMKNALEFLEYYNFDFSKYTINQNIGNCLNEVNNAYMNNYLDDYMVNNVVNGNISPDVLYNPVAMAILYSYDNGKYLNYNDIYDSLNADINDIKSRVSGYSNTK